MKPAKKLVWLGLPAVAIAMIGVACASEGVTEAPSDRPETPDVEAPSTAPDGSPEAGASPCSASGICITSVPIDGKTSLMSVWGSSATDVWAVGAVSTVVHYDGSKWEKAPLVEVPGGSRFTLQGVLAPRSDDVWILAGFSVLHGTGWKGPSATEWSVWSDPKNLSQYAMTGKGAYIWIAKEFRFDVTDPFSESKVLMKFEGWSDGGPAAGETVLSMRSMVSRIRAVTAPRLDEVWGVIDGLSMSEQDRTFRAKLLAPDPNCPAPPCDSPRTWTIEDFDSRTKDSVYALWGHEDVVWLAGGGGMLRRITNARAGDRFEIVPSPVTTDLHGIFGFGPDDIWAVGDDATVLHWKGTSWSTVSTPYDGAAKKPRLTAVWGSAAGDVWIAGEGVMLHFQGDAP